MAVRGLPAYQLYQLTWTLLDWLFPPTCGGCERENARGCDDCSAATRIIPAPVCLYCGVSLSQENTICSRCQTDRPPFTAARSWAFFNGPVRNALHRLKYRRDIALGEVLARAMIQMVRNLDWHIELVIPVPLGAARINERGYNQASFLAHPIALAQGLKYRPNALRRVRETQTQVGLTLAERQANVNGAFQGKGSLLNERNILLIDDVMTSGATLRACTQAALDAGARDVFCLTLARAN